MKKQKLVSEGNTYLRKKTSQFWKGRKWLREKLELPEGKKIFSDDNKFVEILYS